MNATQSTSITITPGSKLTIMSLLVDSDGTAIPNSAITGIRFQIFNSAGTAIVIGGGSITGIVVATSTVTASLATSGGWTASEGFNFSYTYDTASFLSGGVDYRAEVRVTGSFGVVFLTVTINVLPPGMAPS